MNLNILYEDNHILVVVKPSGILSQADNTGDPDMVTLLKEYVKEKYNKPGNVYIGLVQRLDRMTSGVMVFARTSKAASRLSDEIRNHEIKKSYLAVVEGLVKSQETLTHYLWKNEEEVKSYVVNKDQGKLAVLDYRLVKNVDNNSVIDVKLHTGRHHQIRCQMAAIGHPLVGDHLYGSKSNSKMLLHAYKLSFIHPVKKEEMEFSFYPNSDEWKLYL